MSAWEPFDDYMPPESCIFISAEKAGMPIVLRDTKGRWWIRDPLELPVPSDKLLCRNEWVKMPTCACAESCCAQGKGQK